MKSFEIVRWPCVLHRSHSPELVLLHGWGTDSSIWGEWLTVLRQHAHVTVINLPGYGHSVPQPSSMAPARCLEEFLRDVSSELPPRCVILGFSLGGMLAVELAHRYPDIVRAVITIASNARFTANKEWQTAMPKVQFDEFYKNVEERGVEALKSFNVLQAKNCQHQRALVRQLNEISAQSKVTHIALVQSLAWLDILDNSEKITELSQPNLHIFGQLDQLVPEVATKLLKHKGVDVELVYGASHVPFLSNGVQTSQLVSRFLHQLTPEKGLDKSRIARSFSRSAVSYDRAANLQRKVGMRLLQTIEAEPTETVMDLGTGTGFFLPSLEALMMPDQVIAMDIAEGMLSYAKYAGRGSNVHWLCGDAEKIPLADNSVDFVFSSLAIQWCENLQKLFEEVYRVLRPEGSFVFSTLGPDTLFELRQSWRAVDKDVHVQQFAPRSTLLEAMEYFESYQLQEEIYTLKYNSLIEMLKELKDLGANQFNSERSAGLTGKAALRKLEDAYSTYKTVSGRIPASYQVWFGRVSKE